MKNYDALLEFIKTDSVDNVFVDSVMMCNDEKLYCVVSSYFDTTRVESARTNLTLEEVKQLYEYCNSVSSKIKFKNFILDKDGSIMTSTGVQGIIYPALTPAMRTSFERMSVLHNKNILQLFGFLLELDALVVCDQELDTRLTVYKDTQFLSYLEFSSKKLSAYLRYFDTTANGFRTYSLIRASAGVKPRDTIRVLVRTDDLVKHPTLSSCVLDTVMVTDPKIGKAIMMELSLADMECSSLNAMEFIKVFNFGLLHKTTYLSELAEVKVKGLQFGRKMHAIIHDEDIFEPHVEQTSSFDRSEPNKAVYELWHCKVNTYNPSRLVGLLFDAYGDKEGVKSSEIAEMFEKTIAGGDSNKLISDFITLHSSSKELLRRTTDDMYFEIFIRAAVFGYVYYSRSLSNNTDEYRNVLRDLSIMRVRDAINLQIIRYNLYQNHVTLPDNFSSFTPFCNGIVARRG